MWGAGASGEEQGVNSSLPLPPMVGALVADGRYEVKMLGWNTPPEYLAYVDPHWRSFEAPNPAYHYMLGLLYIILLICSLVGNGCVMWVFATAKSLQTPSNMLVINLAMMDFVMMLKTPVFIVSSFNEGPVWGKFGCDVYGLMGAFTGPGAAITNAMIAYDRYKTIAKPFEAKMSRGMAFGIVLFTWLYALPWTILPYLEIWNRFVPEAFLTSCTFDYLTESDETRSFVASIFFFCFIIPASLIVFFYGQIYGHVSAHEKAMREQAKRMNVESLRGVGSKEEQEKSAECRIAKVAMGIFFLFTISWLPYALVALTACFGDRTFLTPVVSMIPACTCKTVACLDPWVYAINHPRYRLELQKRMPWFCIHEEKPSENASQATEKA